MRSQIPRVFLHAIRLVVVAISFGVTACERRQTKEEILAGMSEEDLRAMQTMNSTPLVVEGINEPAFKPASEVDIADDQEIIGIRFGDLKRAYPTKYMSGMLNHVVNDLLVAADGVQRPISVTFCDMTNCVRVLTSETVGGSSHLNVGTLGLIDGGLALRWNGRQFKQTEQIEELEDVPFERMTWGEWKSKYPETEVLVGRKKKGSKDR